MTRRLLACLFAILTVASSSVGQSRTNVLDPAADPRGEPELVVCSQNLGLFGAFADVQRRRPGWSRENQKAKEKNLVRRFLGAQCDVVAAQEILGKDEVAASEAFAQLAAVLRINSNRIFESMVGASDEPGMYNGFLVARDRASIANSIAYTRVELPKLSDDQKPRFFQRAPFEIQLRVKPRNETVPKTVTVINYHFKSRAGGQFDAADLEWETYRMEMSEALRRVAEERHSAAFASGETLLVLAGDRNSHFDTASAKILEGVLVLKQFQGTAACRLSKRGVPLCQAGSALPQRLFSVLTADPKVNSLPGTFRRGGVFSWLDDILLPAESLRTALEDPFVEGRYASGVIYQPEEASDHALVYVRLNW